jgi:transcriptional regulator with XRE-family HTH domain
MTKAKRTPVAYDQPTPQKRAFGARLLLAREQAQLTQAEAAKRLGYAQAVQLSNMENGNRMPPLDVLIRAANLYGTTMDYLCGLSEDPDRDPAAAAVRHVSGRVHAEVHRLVDVMTRTSVEALRKVLPAASEGQRLAGMILEVHSALGTFRTRNKRFDGMPGGNTLATKVEVAADAARAYTVAMNRANRIMQVRLETPNGERAQASLIPVLEAGDA